MAQVHISDWFPSPRSSTFDASMHTLPTHPPELDFDPDFDTRMKSPSPFDATMVPPPPPPKTPKTPKRMQKIARLGFTPLVPSARTLTPRRIYPSKGAHSEEGSRRVRIYNGSSPAGRSISDSSLRVAGSVVAGSPERMALLSSGSPSSQRLPSSYSSPSKRKASGMGGKKLTTSPSAKASLGMMGTVFGGLKRFRAGGIANFKFPLKAKGAKGTGGKYVRARSVLEGKEGVMEVDSPRAESPSDGSVFSQLQLPSSSSSSSTVSLSQSKPPLAITSAEDALSAELDELLFGPNEPMSPATAMGNLSLGGSSSTPDVTTATLESESNPFMTTNAYQDAMGSRSADTLPLNPLGWSTELTRSWTGSTAATSSSHANASPEKRHLFDFDFDNDCDMTPPASPVSISSSARRARSRGKAVRVLGVEARGAAGASGRKGAACASYKEAMYKEFDRRSAKGDVYDMLKDVVGEKATEKGAGRRPQKRSKGRASN